MIKRKDFFFTKIDEEIFSKEVKKISRNISFIDKLNIETSSVIEKESLADCENSFVSIWNKDLFPEIEKNKTSLIYLNRSNSLDPTARISKENFLASGTISIKIYENEFRFEEMKHFVNQVWKILPKITTKNLKVVSFESSDIVNDKPFNVVAGQDAIKWCNADSKNFFKFRSVQVYMKPS